MIIADTYSNEVFIDLAQLGRIYDKLVNYWISSYEFVCYSRDCLSYGNRKVQWVCRLRKSIYKYLANINCLINWIGGHYWWNI